MIIGIAAECCQWTLFLGKTRKIVLLKGGGLGVLRPDNENKRHH